MQLIKRDVRAIALAWRNGDSMVKKKCKLQKKKMYIFYCDCVSKKLKDKNFRGGESVIGNELLY